MFRGLEQHDDVANPISLKQAEISIDRRHHILCEQQRMRSALLPGAHERIGLEDRDTIEVHVYVVQRDTLTNTTCTIEPSGM